MAPDHFHREQSHERRGAFRDRLLACDDGYSRAALAIAVNSISRLPVALLSWSVLSAENLSQVRCRS